jgi:hypothetical protein
VLRRLNVLETFNGGKFVQIAMQTGASTVALPAAGGGQVSGAISSGTWVQANLSTPQIALLNQAYDALKESVYGALVVQTRLKPYFDSVQLQIDATGIHFDASAAITMVQGKAATDSLGAVGDLVDLQKYAGQMTRVVG